MWAENLQKGVLYKDIVGQRADPDLTSTWPTLARPHGSEEVRVWGQASSGKGRPRQVRGQRKHAVTWPDPTFEDTSVYARLVELAPFGDINKYPAGVGAETHLIQRQKMISTNLPRLLMVVWTQQRFLSITKSGIGNPGFGLGSCDCVLSHDHQ